MAARVSRLVVFPGYACNFYCDHCITRDRGNGSLSGAEIKLLSETIARHKIRSLMFVGGEPTLYKNIVNELLLSAGNIRKVCITTNGHFAKDPGSAEAELSAFAKLTDVQLSYDRFHAKFLPLSNVSALYAACRKLKKTFAVSLAVQTPLDMLLVKRLREVGDFKIGVQKVLPFGAAKRNNVGYTFPLFDKSILSKKCPNRKTMAYMCGYGFSVCCGAPDMRAGRLEYVHAGLEEHLASKFYRMISGLTFSGMMSRLGVSRDWLAPEHSAPCTICARIFDEYGKS